ncbi:branched-chain amino acid transport system substrate-binding protein [Methylobacterium sp. ap11]|jgi:branched-chain amino acid transport system substrate-binding protein|uniref:ABC transporter substrate-binding protein n=1 Tax=Methylobacterium sp. ap11 TaxID=1761799 RepID=UPI0008C7D581|nr:ABC transporter substrate-binding protein [Methylobacterium sp. ap11]SEP50208.1 branched-chain amino acid transport system substrate-binding protein [Methylobacterium sp. ap11]
MSMHGLCRIALAVAALAGLAAPARADEPGLTPTAIRIGMFGPLSGASMAYGFDVMNAARMYYDKINKEGGIHGRKIEIVLEDDRCNPNDVVAAVKKLVEQDGVFLLNGGSCSAPVVAAKDYVVRSGVPWVMLNASGDGALYPPQPNIYGAFSISQRAMGGSVIEFASKELKAKKIAYINHDDAYGAWNLEGARFQAKDNGVALVPEAVSPAITDVTAPVLKMRASGADVLVIATYARPAQLILKKAQELGFNKPIVIAVNAIANLKQLSENVGSKEAFRNVYIEEVLAAKPGSEKLAWIYDLYKANYPDLAGKPDHPQVYMPYGIPSAMTVVRALQASGPNPTRAKVIEALDRTDFDSGVMAGPIVLTKAEHAAQKSSTYFKFDGEGLTAVPGSFASRWTYQGQ